MAHEIRINGPDERNVIFDDDIRYVSRSSPFARFIWTLLWIVNSLLALRFLLRLFAANPAAGFTDFIYSATAPLINPFANVIRATSAATGVVEWSTLLAMAVYWLTAYAIVRLVTMTRPVARY